MQASIARTQDSRTCASRAATHVLSSAGLSSLILLDLLQRPPSVCSPLKPLLLLPNRSLSPPQFEEPQPTPVTVPEEPILGWNELVRLVEGSGDLETLEGHPTFPSPAQPTRAHAHGIPNWHMDPSMRPPGHRTHTAPSIATLVPNLLDGGGHSV
ncbi:hypothetical protein EDB86DRAFT_2886819 [Lactarius hatsudake]|nr:hypothetical protein EDB86DRAFT_2886819 [Lactarius hatsudake]